MHGQKVGEAAPDDGDSLSPMPLGFPILHRLVPCGHGELLQSRNQRPRKVNDKNPYCECTQHRGTLGTDTRREWVMVL